MIPTLIVISILAFVIIQLPPGDYLTVLRSQLRESGDLIDQSELAALEARYGLDKPVIVQYWKWVSGFIVGDFGFSFAWQRPVSTLIWNRLFLTFMMTLATTIFVWIVGFAIGLYSATHQYSIGDYAFTTLGFVGLATPNFLLALVLMWIGFSVFGQSVGGLFSPEYMNAPWSFAKLWDMLKHLWIPIIVIGTAGTAGLIRIFRANLLDEMQRPYMDTARAKGVPPRRLIMKYPVRVALIPFVSTVGWTLPTLISGATITAIVLNLPTTGPLLLTSLLTQDMYLAATFIMFLSILTVIGTLISDILLAVVDPRIRLD
jgi:peptide/nickel transport system permease protein